MYTLDVQNAADMTSKSDVIEVCLMLRAISNFILRFLHQNSVSSFKEVSPANRLAGDFLVFWQPAGIRPKVSWQPAGMRPKVSC